MTFSTNDLFPSVPGLEPLQIHTIFCIGRNYALHAQELGNAVPSEPVVFLKPLTSVRLPGQEVRLPAVSERVDHEVEIVAVLGEAARGGVRNVSRQQALGLIGGLGVGLDLTARDLQEAAKKKSLPWTLGKALDGFAPLGRFVSTGEFSVTEQSLSELVVRLSVQGELRQEGRASQMLFPIGELVMFLSRYFTLHPGDLLYTGTPPGVGPLKPGDSVTATLHSGAGQELSRLEQVIR